MSKCISCGKTADVEIETVFRPLTALGERMCEKVAKFKGQVQCICEACLSNAGEAMASGAFSEDD